MSYTFRAMNKRGNGFVIGAVVIFFLGFLSVIVGISLQAEKFDTVLGEDVHQIQFLETKIQKHQAFFELAARDIFDRNLASDVYSPYFHYLVGEGLIPEAEGYIIDDFTLLETNFNPWLESVFNTEWDEYVLQYSENAKRLSQASTLNILESIPIGFHSQDIVLLYRNESAISGFATKPITIRNSGAQMYYYPAFTVDRTNAHEYIMEIERVKLSYVAILDCISSPTSLNDLQNCAFSEDFTFDNTTKHVVTQFKDVVIRIPLIHPEVSILFGDEIKN
jgi:hypothetical protein